MGKRQRSPPEGRRRRYYAITNEAEYFAVATETFFEKPRGLKRALPDVYEQARGVLDLSIRAPLRGGISMKLDAKNLLDQQYELVQGDVVREKYRTGRSFSFGLSWSR